MNPEQIHLHRRKRAHQKLKPYPHKDPKIRLLDNVVTVIAVLLPFTIIPQLLKIWLEKDTAGVSTITWSLFLVFTFPLLLYSIVHKDKRLTLMYSLFIILYIGIIAGLFLFG